MKTKEEIFVSGDMKPIHICNNCEKRTDDGRGFYYWKEQDFTLCIHCIIELNDKIIG